ncbi:putative Mg2+ transporter-C (MgtC) family protein [Desulfonauticus submarinus]|uniref:Putative Mg2+ transporter-C (MgtC) family protein n=1 Tax=Desulfonauticus submarinus TaxID=206665 RepID=A0A1H0A5Z4_9BACT|nr:MgtC/SapB family protein [Desulfonauticus submarinus]SDN29212.1 putative Mg2+ transporter-C (MgtC) family protein [Desulfonauticus submarinus]
MWLHWSYELGLAFIYGGLIGFEREYHGEPAGLRTNILVCIGACLLMNLSLYLPEVYHNFTVSSVIRMDPARIASYTIASIGFLGGGAIIKGKNVIKGLTTAAGLWLVTAIGLSLGAGFYFPATLTTILSLFVLYYLRQIRRHIPKQYSALLVIECTCNYESLEYIKEILSAYPFKVKFINFSYKKGENRMIYKIYITSHQKIEPKNLLDELTIIPSIDYVNWTEGGNIR